MAPHSSAVLFDRVTESNSQRDPAFTTSTRNNANGNSHTALDTSCSGGHCQCHGCGCGCRACCCRKRIFQDESNREVYSGEGGRGIPRPQNGFVAVSSSVSTVDSRPSNDNSFNNSFELHDHLNARLTSNNLARHESITPHPSRRQDESARSVSDEENDDPWPYFVTLADSLDHMSVDADSSGMILAGMDDTSMMLETGGLSSGDISLLSSQYEASFPRQSVTASQLLNGTGAAFANHFLPLTPDCRHARAQAGHQRGCH